ncbi:hypothetical protein O181_044968 [Austropuccinia psidii MF-1]|uniref:Reverse transcriptase domain-containing protein n=1 Tax=Austropuccinia psidii MF-1 TaxID=1389203 RepID=A0A9Q3HH50_9BASI|nr:hypothetical protein [Austropuccinia psidii MF-1]
MDLINVQDAKMQKTKTSRGRGYSDGSSCITNIVINNREAKLHLDSGAFFTCVGNKYLGRIYTDWQERLIPIEDIKFSSASQNMHCLGIFEAAMILPHPSASIKAFASDNEPLGAIKGHEVDNIINGERPYPPLLRRPAYPARPRAREALESHINELMKLGVSRNIGDNEVEVTTPGIITWHNDKSRMVGYFRAFNTYTIPDRYPIPRFHETFHQLSKAKFITSMHSLKGFNHNFLTPHSRILLRILAQCGIYEYLRMPFGIKNAPSHYQIMMNTIFPHELSEEWLIIYIDEIIICSETWQSHLERLSSVPRKTFQVRMKIYLKDVILGFMS